MKYEENEVLCHSYVIIGNASAVKCSIDSLAKK